ncbi:MAG: hypothetical protein JJU08_14500 [Rhodobacteraceae bacterium]|nr:hypothetical protein [Paracoccaceae bacterium]
MIAVWPFSDPLSPLVQSTAAPVDQLVSFQPDIGPAISRPRTTARLELWSLQVRLHSFEQLKDFEAWFDNQLAFGALPFLWLHPTEKTLKRFRFETGTYDESFTRAGRVFISMRLMMLPGALWFASYVPKGMLRIPDFVADYAADRYWIGQQEVAASDLDQISGSYLVVQQQTSGDQQSTDVTYAGDVPQTAPVGVDWIAGFVA